MKHCAVGFLVDRYGTLGGVRRKKGNDACAAACAASPEQDIGKGVGQGTPVSGKPRIGQQNIA